MDDTWLDVTRGYAYDCKITEFEYHSFLPFSTTALSKGDEIRISVQNTDAYTLPCESYVYLEGKINKPTNVGTVGVGNFNLANNGLAFLFSEMRYELNGIEIEKLKSPGIASSMKAFCSYGLQDLNVLANAGWDVDPVDATAEKYFVKNAEFAGCLPLKFLFGFCEDYKKILLNCNQQLILNRSSTDFDALHCTGTAVSENADKNNKVSLELTKVVWKMPVIRVNDREKLKLLRVLDSGKPLSCAFRSWDLCEYPVLPQNKLHTWTVKSSSLLEKPRFVIIGFQTGRKNNLFNSSGRFDHCKLKNLKVYLNSKVYPYEDFRANFEQSRTGVLYKAYADFQLAYYERDWCVPMLSRETYEKLAPLVVVDLSKQDDNVKASIVDLRLEFETDETVPSNTAAYCLILHDRIITYNPFSGDVRKI